MTNTTLSHRRLSESRVVWSVINRSWFSCSAACALFPLVGKNADLWDRSAGWQGCGIEACIVLVLRSRNVKALPRLLREAVTLAAVCTVLGRMAQISHDSWCTEVLSIMHRQFVLRILADIYKS